MSSPKRRPMARVLEELRTVEARLPGTLAFGESVRAEQEPGPSHSSRRAAVALTRPLPDQPASLVHVKKVAVLLDKLQRQTASSTSVTRSAGSDRSHGS
jgi:hypothetical protein